MKNLCGTGIFFYTKYFDWRTRCFWHWIINLLVRGSPVKLILTALSSFFHMMTNGEENWMIFNHFIGALVPSIDELRDYCVWEIKVSENVDFYRDFGRRAISHEFFASIFFWDFQMEFRVFWLNYLLGNYGGMQQEVVNQNRSKIARNLKKYRSKFKIISWEFWEFIDAEIFQNSALSLVNYWTKWDKKLLR